MKLGLCLTGGGAKGAFEAGIIKALHENKLIPNIITGTSIGAINAYFIMKNAIKELEDFWLNIDINNDKSVLNDIFNENKKVIDNTFLINKLYSLKDNNDNIKDVYVNYVEINRGNLSEKIINIKNESKEAALRSIKYSSLLPFNSALKVKNKNLDEIISNYNTEKLFEQFKLELSNGEYDGLKIDGGILNNNFLQPFVPIDKYIDNKVDKLIIVALKNQYEVPEFIAKYYKPQDVIIVKPDIIISPEDTIRFKKDYCVSMFEIGYAIMKNKINLI